MPVAKSYAALTIEEGPYEVNGRAYCKVRQKNGSLRQVRWYTDAEYRRMYPDAVIAVDPDRKTQKDILGFEKGYITIFKGDTYSHLEWFKKSNARYARFWGWYVVSTEEVPADLPTDITPVRLDWSIVGKEDGNLIPEGLIEKAIEPLMYDAHPSEFQGQIGDRLEVEITVKRAIELEGCFGSSVMHIMEDENENVYVWTTAAKHWPEGGFKRIRGTVKDHRIYKNTKQTLLTRVMEVL